MELNYALNEYPLGILSMGELIGCQMICFLTYLTNTTPDIWFVMNTLRHVHLMVAKHVVRYLKGIVDYRLKYEVNQKIMWICIGKEVPLIGRAL